MSTVPYPQPESRPAVVWGSQVEAWEHMTGRSGEVDECPECGDLILSDDPDLTHTPGTERVHASCCPDCNGEPTP